MATERSLCCVTCEVIRLPESLLENFVALSGVLRMTESCRPPVS
jgi:hypothetical protein